MQTSLFLLKFSGLSQIVTLKTRSWSTKPNQHFNMSKCYIHANLVKICQPICDISYTQALFGLYLAVTLKIRSMSQKPNHLFILSQCYIHANLVKLRQLAHDDEICTQETVTPVPEGSKPKTVCSPPLRLGDIIILQCIQLFYKKKKTTFFHEMKQHQFIK